MSGISTGIGLISGIDTATLIDQLMAIEARPKILAITRQSELQQQQAAFVGLNSLLLSFKTAAGSFATDKIFKSARATSSDPNVLTASATTKAFPGAYDFVVDRLVSSHQMLSKGFGDTDTTALGMEDISFELGAGKLSTDTRLVDLNGGEGVARGKINIQDSQSNSVDIDLSKAVTISDVLDAINSNTTLEATASIAADGSGLVITDDNAGQITVSDITGYTTATDLGIAGTNVGGTITGSRINHLSGDTQLSSLNDGNGVIMASGLGVTDFSISTADLSSIDVVLGQRTVGSDTEPAVTTVQGVIDRINEYGAGKVQASIGDDGVSIKIEDLTFGIGTFEVTGGVNGDQTAKDLGILKTGTLGVLSGDRVMAGMNSVLTKSLNGGAGLSGSTTLDITNRDGNFTSISLTENSSLAQMIDEINTAGAGVTASLNKAGNGILITDDTGGSASNLIIQGSAASALGVDTGATGVAASSYAGDNLQHQYVSRASRLEDLNYGRGVGTGSFQITDAMGNQATVTVTDNDKNLRDIISKINSAGLEVNARVNDTGDGLIIENTASSPVSAIEIESTSGSAAKDLRIVGTAADAITDNYIDGSYEAVIDLETTDTLDDVIQKINDAGFLVNATLINDGTGSKPYRLSLTSEISGTAGEMIVDSGSFDFGFSTTTAAQDAIVFFGSTDPADAILISSTTNELDDVIAGVNIDLKSASDTPVQLTVSRNVEKMVTSVTSFVESFNAIIDRINSVDSYDSETETRGVLLGNPTVARIRSQLYRVVQGEADGIDSQYTRLTQVGIRIGEGGKLDLDEDKLRDAISEDLEAVENLFAAKELADDQTIDLGGGVKVDSDDPIYDSLGVAEQLRILMEDLTNSVDGTLTLVNKNYDSQIDLQQKRIEAIDVQLERKREILELQFAAMETALASLQSQQAALASIQTIG
ncbi:MAG: flagellar filament capping protein FliD [Phycisphaerales bacterium]